MFCLFIPVGILSIPKNLKSLLNIGNCRLMQILENVVTISKYTNRKKP